MATIQKFYATAAKKDFARLFQFRLTEFANIDFGEGHYAYVESASIPGRSITNIPVPYMGLSFNLPGTVTYPGSTGYQVTFRCDAKYDIRAALEAATFSTFDEATSTGQYRLPGDTRTLQLELLNKGNAEGVISPVRVYTLYGVYVQSLADTAYTVTDTGTVATIQATLAYQFWRAGKTKPASYTTTNQEKLIASTSSLVNPNKWS